ncbi:uncharacterized protein TNCV_1743621 [Trichonephila clavipes]|nr:uncharacterized protein TNCV_1743621 [Trichonephila clavipes]
MQMTVQLSNFLPQFSKKISGNNLSVFHSFSPTIYLSRRLSARQIFIVSDTAEALDIYPSGHTSGIVFSDADCGAVGPGRRVASPLIRLVEGKERWEDPDYPLGVFPQNCDGTEPNRTVTCMVLKAKANDRRKTLALSRDEFRGP